MFGSVWGVEVGVAVGFELVWGTWLVTGVGFLTFMVLAVDFLMATTFADLEAGFLIVFLVGLA